VNTLVGLSWGVIGITGTLGAIISARIAERYGQGIVLAVMAGASALFQIPHMLAAHAVHLLLARTLLGATSGGFLPLTGAMTAVAVPFGRRGIAYGVNGAAFAFGGGVGPLVIGSAVAVMGVRNVFWIAAIFMLTAAVGSYWIGRELRRSPSTATVT
jgi:MFS family permease